MFFRSFRSGSVLCSFAHVTHIEITHTSLCDILPFSDFDADKLFLVSRRELLTVCSIIAYFTQFHFHFLLTALHKAMEK